jgi:signal peptidase II
MQKNKFKLQFGKVSIILICVMVILLTLDLLTKYLEEYFSWNFTIIPNILEVKSGVRNSGAAFSFLADKTWGQYFLIIITVFMLVLLIGGFIALPERFVLLKLAAIMVIAGALGNLVDRCMFINLPEGDCGVRDFLRTNMIFTWADCNLADYWIVLGVIIAVVDLLFLNEWAVIPLTKKAKAAQAKNKCEQQEAISDSSKNNGNFNAADNANNNRDIADNTENKDYGGEGEKDDK